MHVRATRGICLEQEKPWTPDLKTSRCSCNACASVAVALAAESQVMHMAGIEDIINNA
jgi:hypothetical protein